MGGGESFPDSASLPMQRIGSGEREKAASRQEEISVTSASFSLSLRMRALAEGRTEIPEEEKRTRGQWGKGRMWVLVPRITLPLFASSRERERRRELFPPLPITEQMPLGTERNSGRAERGLGFRLFSVFIGKLPFLQDTAEAADF